MIKAAFFQNFQSHKRTKLLFDPGVNIITGPTDSGKSGLFRGLRWAFTNKPSGSSFRSRWGGKTMVKITTDENIIYRSKDKIEEYTLAKIEDKENKIIFHAFGQNIPKEIMDSFNLSDVNIQSQLDPPFLLSQNSGAVASYFNKIAGLDDISLATVNINKWVRDLSSDISYLEKDSAQKKEQLNKYKYLPKLEIEIEVLEEMEKQQIRVSNSIKRLNALVNEIDFAEVKVSKKEEILPIGILVDKILLLKEEKRIKYAALDVLNILLNTITKVQQNIISYQNVLVIETEVDTLLTLYNNKNNLLIQFATLRKVTYIINDTKALLLTKVANLGLKSKEFKNNIGDICPLCDQPINTHSHNK